MTFQLDQLLAEHVSQMFVGKRLMGVKFAPYDIFRENEPVWGMEIVSADLTADMDREQIVRLTLCDGNTTDIYGNDEVTLEDKYSHKSL